MHGLKGLLVSKYMNFPKEIIYVLGMIRVMAWRGTPLSKCVTYDSFPFICLKNVSFLVPL